MQAVISQLQTALGGQLAFSIGLILFAVLLLQLLVMFTGQLRGVFYARTQRRYELQRLDARLREAKLRCQEAEQIKVLWSGLRKFSVARKVCECQDVFAFYLKPHDGRPLPGFKPGQYLTFQLDIPGQTKPVVRCYSLSEGPHCSEYYRVTIKKERGRPAADGKPAIPPGLASSYFADVVKEGDILNAKAPTGHFYLDMTKTNPVVLIAGGVGVTPMLCMANAIVASGTKREAYFFFGVRSSKEHIHKAEIEKLAAENDNIHVHVCYSRPEPTDLKDKDYDHEGRVNIELLKQVLPSNNFEYYLCGNGAFMKDITDGLEAWGVPEKEVHFEAFGPATVKKKAAPAAAAAVAAGPVLNVTFSKSGKVVPWQPGLENLLDFAREQGVRIDSGCCAGSCGSCLVAIKSGEVEWIKKPDAEPERNTCLTCICRPKGDLELDA